MMDETGFEASSAHPVGLPPAPPPPTSKTPAERMEDMKKKLGSSGVESYLERHKTVKDLNDNEEEEEEEDPPKGSGKDHRGISNTTTVDYGNSVYKPPAGKPFEVRPSEMVMRASVFRQSESNERKIILMTIGIIMLMVAATLAATLTVVNSRSVHAVHQQNDPATSSSSIHSVLLMNNNNEVVSTEKVREVGSLAMLPKFDTLFLSSIESLIVPTIEGDAFVVKVAGIQKFNSTHMRVFGKDGSEVNFKDGDIKYISEKENKIYTVELNHGSGRRLSWGFLSLFFGSGSKKKCGNFFTDCDGLDTQAESVSGYNNYGM